MVSATQERVRCPECGARVLVHPGWTPWCECGWNLAPTEPDAPSGLWETLYRNMGERHGAALFDRLRRHESVRPPFRPSRLLLVAVALLVLGIYAAVPVGALVLLGKTWPNPFGIAAAAVLLAVAIVIRPRPARVPKASITSPTTHPELHGFVSDLARHMEVPPPPRVVLDAEHNAWVGRTGWRQARTLGIGVPTFFAMEPEGWVAQTAHELAHLANGDGSRVSVVHLAMRSLEGWHAILAPGSAREAAASDTLIGVLLFQGLSWLPRSLFSIMVHLSWHDSQQAEYFADRLGATASGSTAFTTMLETNYDTWLVDDAVHRVAQGRTDRGVLAEVRHQQREMPERARERIRRLAARERTPLDATHPPTGRRIRMLGERPVTRGSFTLSVARADRIRRELEEDARRVEAELLTNYEGLAPM